MKHEIKVDDNAPTTQPDIEIFPISTIAKLLPSDPSEKARMKKKRKASSSESNREKKAKIRVHIIGLSHYIFFSSFTNTKVVARES